MHDLANIGSREGSVTLDAGDDITLGGVRGDVVSITAGGAIEDGGDSQTDIRGRSVALRSSDGVGSNDALETSIRTVSAENTSSGNIQLTNQVGGLLTVGMVDGLDGVTNQGGFVSISNASPLTVVESILASGTIHLIAGESAFTGDDLHVESRVTLTSLTGDIVLFAGDNMVIAGDLVAASGRLTIQLDPAAGDPDPAGGELHILHGRTVSTRDGAYITGGGDKDRFAFSPQATSRFFVQGDLPTYSDTGVPPGDRLILDLSDLSAPAYLTLGSSAASGTFNFLSPDTAQPITFQGIEDVNTQATPYHLILDMTLASFQDGLADQIDLRLDGPDAGLQLRINDQLHYVGRNIDLLSLTVLGSADDDTLRIQETEHGLPNFRGMAPAWNNPVLSAVSSAGAH